MASPLILKIQSQLDSKGFRDFQSALRGIARGVTGARTAVLGLNLAVLATGALFAGTFSTTLIRRVALLSIETERLAAQLESFFVTAGDRGQGLANTFKTLTASIARTSLFTQNELLVALGSLGTTTTSVTQATRQLALAQELAAASGVGVATAARAIALANKGISISLSQLTNLTVEQIDVLREEGRLFAELRDRFPEGIATGLNLDTASGQLQLFSNRVTQAQKALGDVFLPTIKNVTKAINVLPAEVFLFGGAIAKTLVTLVAFRIAVSLLSGSLGLVARIFPRAAVAATAFGAVLKGLSTILLFTRLAMIAVVVGGLVLFSEGMKRAEERARTLKAELEALNQFVGKTPDEFRKAFKSSAQEVEALRVALSGVGKQINSVNDLLERTRLGRETVARGIFGNTEERLETLDRVAQGLRKVREERLATQEQLIEEFAVRQRVDELIRRQGAVRLRDEEERLGRLLLTNRQFQELRLNEEVKNARIRVKNAVVTGESILALTQRITAAQIELERGRNQRLLETLDRQLNIRRSIAQFVRAALVVDIPEGADLEEKIRATRDIAAQFRFEQTLITKEQGAQFEEAARTLVVQELALQSSIKRRGILAAALVEQLGGLDALEKEARLRRQGEEISQIELDIRVRIKRTQEELNGLLRQAGAEERNLLGLQERFNQEILSAALQNQARIINREREFRRQLQQLGLDETNRGQRLVEQSERREKSAQNEARTRLRTVAIEDSFERQIAKLQESRRTAEDSGRQEIADRISRAIEQIQGRLDKIRERGLEDVVDQPILDQIRAEVEASRFIIEIRPDIEAFRAALSGELERFGLELQSLQTEGVTRRLSAVPGSSTIVAEDG